MTKFYVSSGTNHRIVLAENSPSAAAQCTHLWRSQKRKLSKSIRVSQVGFDFDSDHPDHLEDAVFSTSYIKALLR